MAEIPATFAEQCEQVIVAVLSPLTAKVEHLMEWLEVSLESESTRGSPGPVAGGYFLPDLAPGMLTDDLLADSPDS